MKADIRNIKISYLFQTHLVGGRTIYSNGLFRLFCVVHFGRYIHRRELRVVSIENASIAEFEIKMIY